MVFKFKVMKNLVRVILDDLIKNSNYFFIFKFLSLNSKKT